MSGRGFRVTQRDREIVRWIGRLRMVSAAQVADRFGLGRAVAYNRLRGLVGLGLLEHQRIFHAAPGVYLTSRAGLAATGVDLPPAHVDLRTYDHDLELSSLLIDLELEFGEAALLTEREMRATDAPIGLGATRTPTFAVPLTGGRGQLQLTPVGRPRLHFPDVAIRQRGDGSTIAIELERTAKGRARLRGILAAYTMARHIERVRYYATPGRVLHAVEAEARELRAESLIEVRERTQTRDDANVAA